MNQYSELFEIPKGIYALSHSVGPCIKNAIATLQQKYFVPWHEKGGDAWPIWLEEIDKFCGNISRLINASKDEICPQPNLASGFYAYLTAICKLAETKNGKKDTILMHKEAFASMGFVVKGLASTFNIKLVLIDGCANKHNAWEMALKQHRVLACLFTHVHSNKSIKSNIDTLSKLCKKYQAFALVDIAQSVGIVKIDVKNWGIDAAFGSCVKWLCSGPGAGFMYVNKENLCQLEPDPVGWFSHNDPFEFDIEHFTYCHSALRFWGGTPNIVPYVIANQAIMTILDIGLEKIVTHNLELKHFLLSNLPQKVADLNPHSDPEKFGGSLCITPNVLTATTENLVSSGVRFDVRNEVIRISLHIFNTEVEAEQIARCFK